MGEIVGSVLTGVIVREGHGGGSSADLGQGGHGGSRSCVVVSSKSDRWPRGSARHKARQEEDSRVIEAQLGSEGKNATRGKNGGVEERRSGGAMRRKREREEEKEEKGEGREGRRKEREREERRKERENSPRKRE